MPQLATPLMCAGDGTPFGRLLTREDILNLLGGAGTAVDGSNTAPIIIGGAQSTIVGVTVNGAGHLIVVLSSGTTIDAGLVPAGAAGAAGSAGVSINTATVNNVGHLILTLTDGSMLDAGLLPGVGPVTIHNITYTASAAVDPSYDRVFLDTAVTAAFTLPAGVTDGQQIIVKRLGVGANTLALQLDSTATTLNLNTTATPRESITLLWSATRATWLLV